MALDSSVLQNLGTVQLPNPLAAYQMAQNLKTGQLQQQDIQQQIQQRAADAARQNRINMQTDQWQQAVKQHHDAGDDLSSPEVLGHLRSISNDLTNSLVTNLQSQKKSQQEIEKQTIDNQNLTDERNRYLAYLKQNNLPDGAFARMKYKVESDPAAAKEAADARKATADAALAEMKTAPRTPDAYQRVLDIAIPATDKDNLPLKQRTQAEIQRALSVNDFAGADKAIEDMNGQLRQLEVATNPKNIQSRIQITQGGQANSLLERSYQYNQSQIDNLAKPINETVARMSRLKDTLAQNTPQADAFVAPELLSVLAGGSGSGLRMNQAEIDAILGGRSKWESLKASLQKWSLDPTKASALTAEQKRQMGMLVDAVNAKLQSKSQAVNDASGEMVGAENVEKHRDIAAKLRQKLNDIDNGQTGSGGFSVKAPNGKTYTFKTQADLDAFKKSAGIQ